MDLEAAGNGEIGTQALIKRYKMVQVGLGRRFCASPFILQSVGTSVVSKFDTLGLSPHFCL